jgi:hypothetical protein
MARETGGGGRGAGSQRWATFVRNHARAVVACDLRVAVTATFRVLYVFVAMEVGSRRLLHVNVSSHPTAVWTVQQFRETLTAPHAYRFVLTIGTASTRRGSTPPSLRWVSESSGRRSKLLWRTAIVNESWGRDAGSAWTSCFPSERRICGRCFVYGDDITTRRGPIASWDPACRSPHPVCRLPRSSTMISRGTCGSSRGRFSEAFITSMALKSWQHDACTELLRSTGESSNPFKHLELRSPHANIQSSESY